MEQRPRPASHRYVPALDGLRAIAVLVVIVSHAWVAVMPGGWAGVDVFFVLSGYLITSLLLAEHARTGRVSLPRFYLRRALRLLPAICAAVLFAVVVAAVLLPDTAADTDHEALAALAYVTNWALVIGHPENGLLLHTWSLSIEEQFYLLWPVLLLVLLGLGGRRIALVATLTIIAAIMLHRLSVIPGDYFRTDTRADSLMVGCAVALAASMGVLERSPAWCIRIAAAVGAVTLAVVYLRLSTPGSALAHGVEYTLIAMAAASLVIAAAERPILVVARALSWRPLLWVGRRSYGLYLYHPICIAIVATRVGEDSSLTLLAGAPLAVVIAALSYRYLELPFLRLKDRPSRSPRGAIEAAAA